MNPGPLLTSPAICRACFPCSARTSNDNGAGAESGPSNTISVGRPIAPAVTATGSASGVEVSFTPDAASLLTTDTFRYWAVGSDGTTERLAEAAVGAVTVGAGASVGRLSSAGFRGCGWCAMLCRTKECAKLGWRALGVPVCLHRLSLNFTSKPRACATSLCRRQAHVQRAFVGLWWHLHRDPQDRGGQRQWSAQR